MLRITTIREDAKTITMKLEGKLASHWVPLLESECKKCPKDKRRTRQFQCKERNHVERKHLTYHGRKFRNARAQ